MKVRFWGVRGSVPAPGPETNRYGGNTSCVSLEAKSGQRVILDMGTGLVGLGAHLMAGPLGRGQGQAAVLLSHAHWDHIQGFPFFPPVFVPGNQFHIYGHAHSSDLLEGILEGQMNPHFSPIYTIKNLGATIGFTAVTPGEVYELDGLRVRAEANPHGHTSALAFRIEEGDTAVVYAPDAGYPAGDGEATGNRANRGQSGASPADASGGGPTPAVLDLYRGADLLIHDATFTPADQATRLERGNSSYVDAAAAAAAAGVRHLVLFHYDQDYSDDKVDRVTAACRDELDRRGGRSVSLTAAAEGLELEV